MAETEPMPCRCYDCGEFIEIYRSYTAHYTIIHTCRDDVTLKLSGPRRDPVVTRWNTLQRSEP